MILTSEDARRVVFGDIEGWREIESKVIDTTRWSVIEEGVFFHEDSKKFYEFCWSSGATECQDERPFEYDDEVAPVEVEAKEVTTTVYVPVEVKVEEVIATKESVDGE